MKKIVSAVEFPPLAAIPTIWMNSSTRNNAVCPPIAVQSNANAMACKKQATVVEDVGATFNWLTEIPGAHIM